MLRTLALGSFGLLASTLVLSHVGHADRTGRADAAVPASAAAVPASELDGSGAPAASSCFDTLGGSPVVLFTSAGGTLLGLQLDQVTVYSNGLVLLASADDYSGGMSARMAQVAPTEVARLARALAQRGAYSACDQDLAVSDVPLRTLSVARATGTDVALHSFSYWLATDRYGAIESALEQWMIDNRLAFALPE